MMFATDDVRMIEYRDDGRTIGLLADGDRVQLADAAPPGFTPERARALVAAMSEAAAPLFRQFGEAAAAVGQALDRWRGAYREAGLLPDAPPEDPRARALWLARNRNTGPARDLTQQRRPRNLR